MILLEIIKFLAALIVIAVLSILLVAIVISGWRVIVKNEQKNQEKES
ncbi:TPA: hypothetical protein ACGO8F_001406 [Streptococcus suis]